VRRVAILLLMLGACAPRAPASGPSSPESSRLCERFDRVHCNVCIVADAVDRARKSRDLVALLCRHDRLERMQGLLRQAETGDSDAAAQIANIALEAEACSENLSWVPSATTIGPRREPCEAGR
jgi:hypothetical protein